MKFDSNNKIEYGTFLEYVYKGKTDLQRTEFWGADHSGLAMNFFVEKNLKELTFTHKFGPVQREL